jgi:hypothetical protein
MVHKITNAEGARALRISVRQFKRLKVRLKAGRRFGVPVTLYVE